MTLLELDTLTKRFEGLVAVDEVSVSLEEDTLYALIGPNGAGKTTLFNCVTGMLPVTSGTVAFKGRDITGESPHEISQAGIGRTFQDVRPFDDMTVAENVRVGGYFAGGGQNVDGLVEEAIDIVNLSHVKDKRASSLTTGQLRLLELARVLATDPDLIMLDEPVAGLNPQETREVVELLPEILSEVKGMFLVEHDMSAVMNVAEHIFVISDGSLIAEGPPKEVSNDPQVIESYLGPEAGKYA